MRQNEPGLASQFLKDGTSMHGSLERHCGRGRTPHLDRLRCKMESLLTASSYRSVQMLNLYTDHKFGGEREYTTASSFRQKGRLERKCCSVLQ